MMLSARRALAALALCLAPLALPLAAAGDVTGHWEGGIQLPGMELKVLVDLKAASAGALEGTIDIPAQGAKGLALDSIEAKDAAVSFAIRGVPAGIRFVLDDKGAVTEALLLQPDAVYTIRRK